MLVVRSGVLASGNAQITGLKRTDDLNTGIYVYGSGIPVDSFIYSIDSSSKITLNNLATISSPIAGSTSLEFTTARVGTYLERRDALLDVKNIVDERGDYIEIFLRDESDVTRDQYGSIKKRNISQPMLKCNAFPVQYSPSEKQLEKAGIKESADVIVYTAMLDWINGGYGFSDIDINGRLTANLQNESYELKNKGLFGQMNDVFKYITLGLHKR
jgi:hypothetical protein